MGEDGSSGFNCSNVIGTHMLSHRHRLPRARSIIRLNRILAIRVFM
jgi:hypothetical protein